jgi:hypothetical protein
MAIREALQKNRPLAYGVAGVLLVGAVGLMAWTNRTGMPDELSQLYYSDDDGRTYFADDIKRVPPFDHNGKQADLAAVFRAGGGAPFVGYLERYSDAGVKRLAELAAAPHTGGIDGQIAKVKDSTLLVKRPGEPTWHPAQSPGAAAVLNPTPPAGQSGALQSVNP